jgi:hypothetical protein
VVLLFGMPRSGTTWLAKIFDSHPDTLYRHEPDSYGRLDHLPWAPEPGVWAQHHGELRDFVQGLAGIRDAKISATLPQFHKNYLNLLQRSWNRGAVTAVKVAGRLSLRVSVPLWLPVSAVERSVLVSKSIESLARMGLFATALPDSRNVVIVRHPCGYLGSVLRGRSLQQFDDNESIGEDHGILKLLAGTQVASRHGVSLDYLCSLPPLERIVWQWVLTNDKALQDSDGLSNVCAVSYEQFCADPLNEAKKLYDWVGLDLAQQTIDFLSASTTTHRDRYYSVYKDPMRTANAWRQQLPEDVQRRVIAIAGHSLTWQRYYAD